MTANRFYSSQALPTTLVGNITSGATSLAVAAATGFPASTPFVIAVDYGGATEELMDVTSVSGTTFTVSRAVDGSSAQSHGAGAVVQHVTTARDFAEPQAHMGATSAVHGVTGALVGTTDTQTVTNKTLTNPTINGSALSGTITGSPTLSGAPTFSGDYVSSGSPNFTGNPTFNASSAVPFKRPVNTNPVINVMETADTQPRLTMQADGTLKWGPGSLATDTSLFRGDVNTLQTNGSLSIGQNLQVSGNVTLAGSLAAGNLTLASWSSWTVLWTTSTGSHSPSFGNATVASNFAKNGRSVFYSLYISFGSSTDFGSGATTSDNWQFSTPNGITASSPYTTNSMACGSGRLAQGSLNVPVIVRMNTAGTSFMLDIAGGRSDGAAITNTGTVDSLSPWSWTSGSTIQVSGFFEATT